MDNEIAGEVWHAGEALMQGTVGAVERMREVGRRVIRDYMPDQHRDFFQSLPFIVIGTVSADGLPYANIVTGEPGFMSTPDARTISLECGQLLTSSAESGLKVGCSVAILGIELHTRRRNRVNGLITHVLGNTLTIAVEHSFGNCPKYIQLREVVVPSNSVNAISSTLVYSTELTVSQRTVINSADTMFVASYADILDSVGRVKRQVDVSHRGGKNGFIRVSSDDTITIPDFVGNNFFNTLGNIILNPHAGLLFIDFSNGQILQVQGRAEVDISGTAVVDFRGAERVWKVKPSGIYQSVAQAIQLQFRELPDGLSPFLLDTGQWGGAGTPTSAPPRGWHKMRVERIDSESSDVCSFYLAPMIGSSIPKHLAGQHVSLQLHPQGELQSLIRTYTVSSAPGSSALRVSVKKVGAGSAAVHGLVVGSHIYMSSPSGSFVLPDDISGGLVFLAGGIGITPILAMLHEVEARVVAGINLGKTTVIYSVKKTGDFALLTEIEAICRRLTGTVELIRLVSQDPGGRSKASYDATGRLRGTLLSDREFTSGTHAFVCGPQGFMATAVDILLSLGLSEANVHTETFGPNTPLIEAGFKASKFSSKRALGSVSVHFSKSGRTANWNPGMGTLLDLAENIGINPEFSCRTGICGTCRTPMTTGAIQGQIKEGDEGNPAEILICCSYPASGEEEITLDL